MKTVMKGGLWIGILCSVWLLVMGVTGWYKDPVMLNAFYLVILIQIGVLIWMLRQTAAAGAAYGRQVVLGTLMSVTAGVFLFFVSLLFTTVLFPHYFEELRTIHEQMLRTQGKTDAEIAQMLEVAASTQTPLFNALSGFLGTTVTGLIASALIGVFVRKNGSPTAPPAAS
jgi:hypothetical protein